MRIIVALFIISVGIFGAELTQAKIKALAKKGQKIAEIFCKNLPKVDKSGSIEQIQKEIKNSNSCSSLSPRKLKAVAIYLKMGVDGSSKKLYKEVPKGAKCPVCGMFVYKYPKWAAKMVVDKRSYYFDGVKDMMKFYFFDGDFPYDRAKISQILVSDFYTLEPVDAKKAFYVIGSNVYGPMGNELIPFKDEKSAKEFLLDHKGEKIVKFNQITPQMVMALDGIKME